MLVLQNLWRWFERMAQSPYALVFLFAYSFIETLITLLPIDPFVIAVMLADRKRSFYIAGVITIGSLFGAVVGYWIGSAAFLAVGAWLLSFEGASHAFTKIQHIFLDNSALITFTTALVPIPKTPTILAAGFLHSDIVVFAVSWVLGRSIHFFGEAVVVHFGTHEQLSRSLKLFAVGSVVLGLIVFGWIAFHISGI